MKSAVLFFKTLFSGGIAIITWIAIITFTTAYTIFDKNSTGEDILSNIGISFLATSLVAGVQAIKGTRALSLLELFSINPLKKTAIVIPEFNKGKIVLDSGANKEIELKEIPSMSKTDLLSANYLVALLQKHNIDLPEILTDQQALEIIADVVKLKEYKTFISIGLNSNQFSKKIAQMKLKDIVDFDNSTFPSPNEKMILFKSGEKLQPYKLNHICDLILLSKVLCDNSGNEYSVTICGGLNATGTKLIGEHIYNNWYEDIYSLKLGKTPVRKCQNYALLYEVNGQSGTRLDPNATLVTRPIHTIKF